MTSPLVTREFSLLLFFSTSFSAVNLDIVTGRPELSAVAKTMYIETAIV